MRWAVHVARVLKTRGAYEVLVRKLSERIHLEDLGLCGRIILKCMLSRLWRRGLDCSGSV